MTEPNWSYVENCFAQRARAMGMPDWHRVENQFIEVAFQFQNSLQEAAGNIAREGERKSLWARVLNLTPEPKSYDDDGTVTEWAVTYGRIVATGKSPEAAVYAFEKLFTTGKQ